jgi:hypothetical protein
LKKDVETLEKNLAADAENMSALIEVIGCMQEANKAILGIIKEQDKRIDNIHVWFFIRQFILTALVVII